MGISCSKCLKINNNKQSEVNYENGQNNKEISQNKPNEEIKVIENDKITFRDVNKEKESETTAKENKQNFDNNQNKNKTENVQTKIENKELLSGTIKTNKDDYFDSKELAYYIELYKFKKNEDNELKKITRYQKGELLGEGSFGKVYKVFEEEGGQIFAMKEIDLRRVTEKHMERIKSFELEIDLLSKLQHKNIIKYFGTYRNNETLAIFLDYCVGGSIAKMIDDFGKFPEHLIRKYTKQILEGLEYLHAHDVIHRDIKGANILVDKEGVCKLTDFGGSKQLVEEIDSEKQKSFKGTPHWMAPETVKTMESTRFSDIWSLGCTVIEMATGQPPWSQFSNQITALYNIMNATKPPDFPDFLSDSLKDFLSKCMKLNPKERWNVCKLLKHPFVTGEEVKKRESKRRNSDKNMHETLGKQKRKDSNDVIFKNSEIQISNIDPIFNSLHKKNQVNANQIKV